MYDRNAGGASDEAALVVAAQNGDQAALDVLVDRYLPLLYNIVGRALDGNHDVDDVVQETLFRVVDRLRELRDPAAFRSWTVAIATRLVRDRWRSRQAQSAGFERDPEAQLDAADPGADFVDLTILRLALTDQRRETALATRWLDEDDRELLALWWLEAAGELTRADLVAALGLSAGHVSVRVQRMKAQLETARTVVRAIQAAPWCREFDALARRWDGRPSSAWRKLFARHIRDCVTCAVHREGLVPAERLLAGLSLVPVPILLAAHFARAAHAPAAALKPKHPASHSRRAVKHGHRTARRFALHGSAKVIAAVVVVAAVAGTVYAATRSAPANTSATITVTKTASADPTVAATLSASPSAAKASASPTTSPKANGDCARAAGTSPVVKTTTITVGESVTGYGGQSDTEPLPMAIAATPSGRSWLAWLGTNGKVYLGNLDCDDHLIGTPTSFTGIDLEDVAADANGGVLLLTRKGDCHTGPLCGGTSSPCNTMWMVRFDNSGHEVWEQQVTNLSSSLGGYDSGARFVWWYQHHGRLASNGTDYAAYFADAITVQNGSCVDIHEGDRMEVVGPTGSLLSGHDSFALGCSHSWDTHIVWDPRVGHFIMVCATDNDCRIAQPAYRTVASGTCDGTLFGGDVVLSSNAGYWVAWSQGGHARLDHFSTGSADKAVTTSADTSHPHLVSYGSRMLLAWGSGSKMAAQVYNAGTGAAVGSQFTINVRDHAYMSFKPFPDGSAAYPAAGSTSTSIVIARVMPMS
ncbi:RNA polymerase sigma factor [Actinospica robiniae]|uniref:RNA polymerase sigma factor n=1 Tax=Actinospica robiniae TaxID=304901 RepID=UPI0003FABC36|nr:sigma-70 family RNA polymerase sigma factor [Actinospica robiniae]